MAEHLSQSELDYPFKLLEYLNGFRISKAIFSACELGVFELLLESEKALTAGEMAQKLGTSEDGLERLLDLLVAIEILNVELVQGTAYYNSTDVANLYLAKSSPKSLHTSIIYQSQTIYPLWNNLTDAVRMRRFYLHTQRILLHGSRRHVSKVALNGKTALQSSFRPYVVSDDDMFVLWRLPYAFLFIEWEGKNQNEKTFGLPSEEIFSAIYRSEDEMLKFMGLMNSTWVIDGHDIATAFDLSCFKSIIDLGGCSGALARELAKEYPSSTVTVLDLPDVIQSARRHFAQEGDTILFQEGDFFDGEIPSADLYILARIVHDWKYDKNLKLLKKIHTACNTGGGVLIAEALLFENRRGPTVAQMFSLNMLVQTEGKEHPPSHYTHLLNEAGFRDVHVCRTGKSYDAILALK